MKNKSASLLLLTILPLVVLCAWQWRELRAQRQRLNAVEAARRADAAAREELEGRLKESDRSRARMERDLQEFAAVTAMLRASESKQSSNVNALAKQFGSTEKEGAEAEGKGGLFGKGMGEMMSQMLKNPEMRQMMRAQQKTMIDTMYSGLFKELKLTPEQQEKLTESLLDSQMKNLEAAQGLFGNDKGDSAEMARSLNEQKKAADDQLKALLGEEKFAQYEDYQKNIGERRQLDQLRTQLEGQNLPLQDQQASQLLQIMKDEKARVPPVIPSGTDRTPEDIKGMFSGEKLDQQLQWMEDYNKRVLDRAGQVLTPAQLQQFVELQNQQTSMQRMGLKMAREMFGKAAPGK